MCLPVTPHVLCVYSVQTVQQSLRLLLARGCGVHAVSKGRQPRRARPQLCCSKAAASCTHDDEVEERGAAPAYRQDCAAAVMRGHQCARTDMGRSHDRRRSCHHEQGRGSLCPRLLSPPPSHNLVNVNSHHSHHGRFTVGEQGRARHDGPAGAARRQAARVQSLHGQRRVHHGDCWQRLLCHCRRHTSERGLQHPDTLQAQGVPAVSGAVWLSQCRIAHGALPFVVSLTVSIATCAPSFVLASQHRPGYAGNEWLCG